MTNNNSSDSHRKDFTPVISHKLQKKTKFLFLSFTRYFWYDKEYDKKILNIIFKGSLFGVTVMVEPQV